MRRWEILVGVVLLLFMVLSVAVFDPPRLGARREGAAVRSRAPPLALGRGGGGVAHADAVQANMHHDAALAKTKLRVAAWPAWRDKEEAKPVLSVSSSLASMVHGVPQMPLVVPVARVSKLTRCGRLDWTGHHPPTAAGCVAVVLRWPASMCSHRYFVYVYVC